MTTKKSPYKGTPEVTPKGVQKLGTVTVTPKKSGGKDWKRLFVSGVLFSHLAWGVAALIYYVDNPVHLTNALWLFTAVNGAAIGITLFSKRE